MRRRARVSPRYLTAPRGAVVVIPLLAWWLVLWPSGQRLGESPTLKGPFDRATCDRIAQQVPRATCVKEPS